MNYAPARQKGAWINVNEAEILYQMFQWKFAGHPWFNHPRLVCITALS